MNQWLAIAGLAFGVVGTALAVIALYQLRLTQSRVAEITPDIRGLAQRVRGREAQEALAAIFAQLETSSRRMEQVEAHITELDRIMSRAIRRVGLVRYDANNQIRGELSFALCLLDNRDNGLMLTSNYTLEGCRIFVRGVLAGKVQHDLLAEEQEALQQALGEP